MGTNSAIEWTTHSWNPWQGCRKVSAGCKFCYMYRDKKRYGQDPETVVRSKNPTFNKPIKTTKHIDLTHVSLNQDGSMGLGGYEETTWAWPDGGMVFTCSWSDWFIEEADEWRDEAWDIIRQRPGLTFQILTKRPEPTNR